MSIVPRLFLAGLLLLVSACATMPLNFDHRSDYWQKRPPTLVLIAQPDAPESMRRPQRKYLKGLLNVTTASDLTAALGTVNLMPHLEKLRKGLSNTLKTRHVPHKWERQTFDVSTLGKRGGPYHDLFSEQDFSAARSNWPKAEYLLIIELIQSGTARPFYGMLPTGNPGGYAHLQVRLINLANNRIVWREKVIRERTVSGGWDSWDRPPRYAALQTAMVKAVKDTCGVANRAFSYPNSFR